MIAENERVDVLIVDDEETFRRSINKQLTKKGYFCREASCATEAMDNLGILPVDLIILDTVMPGESGVQLLPEIKKNFPGTAVLMTTSVPDPGTIINCMKNGAHDYLSKPFDRDELNLAVSNALLKRKLEVDIRGHRFNYKQQADDETIRVRQLTLLSFDRLITSLEAQDEYMAGHSRRVCGMALEISQSLELTPGEIEDIRWGALLHDVGMLAVDNSIQNKPGKLTQEEYHHIMLHAVLGPEIVRPVANEAIISIIKHHHDRYDGQGFEQKQGGRGIPVGARIVAVADAFDAMVNDRPYRKALPVAQALTELNNCCESQFDPEIVRLFLDIQRKYLPPDK